MEPQMAHLGPGDTRGPLNRTTVFQSLCLGIQNFSGTRTVFVIWLCPSGFVSCLIIRKNTFIMFLEEDFVAKTAICSPVLLLTMAQRIPNQDTLLLIEVLVTVFVSCCRFGVELTYYGISLNIAGFGLNLYLTQFVFASMELLMKICAYFFLEKIGRRSSVMGALFLTGLCLLINIFVSKGYIFTVIIRK